MLGLQGDDKKINTSWPPYTYQALHQELRNLCPTVSIYESACRHNVAIQSHLSNSNIPLFGMHRKCTNHSNKGDDSTTVEQWYTCQHAISVGGCRFTTTSRI